MAKHDANHTQKHNLPLTPSDDAQFSEGFAQDTAENAAALEETQLHIHAAKPTEETQKISTHTSRIPPPVERKPSAKKSKKSAKKHARHAHSIFKPKTKQPNFILSVAVSTIRLTTILILCVCLAVVGALVGIAKAYVDTAPTLDLAALDSQDKTSFIYDSKGNLITAGCN